MINNVVRHCKTVEILFPSDILSCLGHTPINQNIIALVIIFLEPLHIRGYASSRPRTQDALASQNEDDTDILKVLQCFVWSKTLF